MDSKPLSEQVVTKPFKYTEERMIKAIRAANGNKSAAARMLNCHRVTITEYIERSDAIREAYEQEVQGMIDEGEDRLAELMRQDEDKNVAYRATELLLTTRGKDRGWFKKMQGNGIQANVVNVLNQVFPATDGEIDESELEEIVQGEIEED